MQRNITKRDDREKSGVTREQKEEEGKKTQTHKNCDCFWSEIHFKTFVKRKRINFI